MKITITDGNSTIVIENPESADSTRNRKLMDVLFSQEPTAVASRVDTVVIPTTTREFRSWLRSGSPVTRVAQLSAHLNYELVSMRTVYNLVTNNPSVVTGLGISRFLELCKWMHFNDWLTTLPRYESMRTYYNLAVRNANS